MRVLGIVRYTEIHIRHHVLVTGKLQYPVTIWSQRCWISQIVLHLISFMSSLSTEVLIIYLKLPAAFFITAYLILFLEALWAELNETDKTEALHHFMDTVNITSPNYKHIT
jgi:hypothetical protein